MSSLFDSLPQERTFDWKPLPPPVLDDRWKEIEIDYETTGLFWWERDETIGAAIGYQTDTGYHTQYLPYGHRGGGNLPKAQVLDFLRGLQGKHIRNLNTRFDIHFAKKDGVDFEAQGCTVSDCGHYAALLDDHRFSFSLDALAQDYLGKEKIGKTLDGSRMADYHAGEVAPRAEGDVRLVRELTDKMWPQLDAEDLQAVRQLEDDVIFVTCEMERNGAPINVELLDQWMAESKKQYEAYLWEVYRASGLMVNPDSPKDMQRLFEHLKIPIERTEKGSPSFTDDIVKTIDHPTVKLIRKAGKLATLRSTYLLKYKANIDSKGILRYALHQLRTVKDQVDTEKAGTISGRYSSGEITKGVGVNIQGVMKVEKQLLTYGEDFLIRQLFVPASGLWLSADASAIEYRLFAHHANNPRILAAFKENPRTKFHRLVLGMLQPKKPDLTYKRCKDCNFMNIYGGGIAKLALMLEFISKSKFTALKKEFNNRIPRTHPLLQEALEIKQIYDREMPEVPELIRKSSDLAATRGFVKTILGRRTRFPNKERLHKALNGVIQGTAADVMKTKLVELHRARRDTNFLMRFTVHDEVDGDARDPECAAKVAAILDEQSFPKLRVPILWDVKTGVNWRECADD